MTRPDTFVIDLRPLDGDQRYRSGEGAAGAFARRIAARRIRSPEALRSVFLQERVAGRPALFISATAAHLSELSDLVHDEGGNLRLLLLEEVSLARKQFLEILFRTVLSTGGDLRFPTADEIVDALSCEYRRDLIVGGVANPVDKVIVLYRGSLDRLSVPFAWFSKTLHVEPDFDDLAITDCGQTLRLGHLEVAADCILDNYDPDYRARAKKRRLACDDSLGRSIRRLREMKGVRQSDFGTISEQTISRIERGELNEPRARTLKAIARRLGVSPEDLATY